MLRAFSIVLFHNDDRDLRIRDHVACLAAEHDPPYATAAMCRHDDEICFQRAGGVHGRAVGSHNGEALGKVQVQLFGAGSIPAAPAVVTNDDGTFQFANVSPGTYTLQASAVGYRLLNRDVSVGQGESKSMDLVLTSSTAQRTDVVEVSAGGFDAVPEQSASGMTLERDERKNLASVLADDPLRTRQSMPGVTSNNDFSSEFSVRGAPFSRIGLFYDGILLHAPFHTTDGQTDNGSLTIFNGDMVDDITLFQGAWPSRYSDRTAGVVAAQSRDGDRDEMHWRLSASMSNASVLAEGPKIGRAHV